MYLGVQLVVVRAVKRKVAHPPSPRWILCFAKGLGLLSHLVQNTNTKGSRPTAVLVQGWGERDRRRGGVMFLVDSRVSFFLVEPQQSSLFFLELGASPT